MKRLVMFIAATSILVGCVPPGEMSRDAPQTFVKHDLNLAAGQTHVIDLPLAGTGMIWLDCMAFGKRGENASFRVTLDGPGNRGGKNGHYAYFQGVQKCNQQYYVKDDDLSWGTNWKVVVKNMERHPIRAIVNIRYPGYRYAEQEPGYYPSRENSAGYQQPPAYSPPAPRATPRPAHTPGATAHLPAPRPPAARPHSPRPAPRAHRAEPATRHREHAAVPAHRHAHPAKPAVRKPVWINRNFSLSASFGNRQVVQFRLKRPGRVILNATWQNGNIPLAIMLNGPGQTSAYARRDGKSRLRVEFVVTSAMLAKGNTWTATIANFSRKGPVNGVFRIGYPGR